MALTKVRGGAIDTVVLADSTNLNFGTGSDAKIFHDGNNTKFQHTGTGGLYVGADTFAITNGATDTNHISIDSNGHVTKPKQPAFLVHSATGNTNFALDTTHTVAFATEIFDQNADFASNTFTAPVTGRYQLNAHFYFEDVASSANYLQADLNTSNRIYYSITDPSGYDTTVTYHTFTTSILADMDANDTATMSYRQSGGDQQIDLSGSQTYFSGYLVC